MNPHFTSLISFNAFPKNFNFVHANVRGLLDAGHFEQMKNLMLRCKNISAFALSETPIKHK